MSLVDAHLNGVYIQHLAYRTSCISMCSTRDQLQTIKSHANHSNVKTSGHRSTHTLNVKNGLEWKQTEYINEFMMGERVILKPSHILFYGKRQLYDDVLIRLLFAYGFGTCKLYLCYIQTNECVISCTKCSLHGVFPWNWCILHWNRDRNRDHNWIWLSSIEGQPKAAYISFYLAVEWNFNVAYRIDLVRSNDCVSP